MSKVLLAAALLVAFFGTVIHEIGATPLHHTHSASPFASITIVHCMLQMPSNHQQHVSLLEDSRPLVKSFWKPVFAIKL